MAYKRRQYWVNQKIQWPFTKAILLVSVFSGIFGAIIAFGIGVVIASVKSGAGDFSTILQWLLAPNKLVFLLILFGFFGFIAIMAWYGVRLSHKIAGPLIPILRGLERLRQGDFSQPIRIRQEDLLHDLVEELNKTIEILRQRNELQEKKIQELSAPGNSDATLSVNQNPKQEGSP